MGFRESEKEIEEKQGCEEFVVEIGKKKDGGKGYEIGYTHVAYPQFGFYLGFTEKRDPSPGFIHTS